MAVELLAQGAIASVLGARWGLPRWWHPINLVLPAAAWAGLAAQIDPAWFLGAFVAAFLVFGATTWKNGVPLYFSSESAVSALCELLPAGAGSRVLDAGSGVGTVLVSLSARRPDVIVEGVEAALLPWLLSWLRGALNGAGFRASLGDFWDVDFGRFDFVYAFLSPAPMHGVWDKARREMRPGSVFVSNSFTVPGVAPARVLDLDGTGRSLYVWHM